MEIKNFIDKIGLSKAASAFIMEFEMPEEVYLQWKHLFDTDVKKFLEKGKETEAFEQTALYLYIRFAAEADEMYREANIAEEVYFLTMRDIVIWENVYEKKYGQPGLRELEWLSLSVKGKLFRLGRLQFEPMELEEKIKAGGRSYPKGMKVLNVHIPEDGKLSPEECQKAFEEAERFFGVHNTYLCESWLLSPVLRKLLDEKSNIIAFQNRFQVYKVIYPFRQAEERVFGKILDSAADYPENTKLQKKLKEWLKVHPEDIGMGMGIFTI